MIPHDVPAQLQIVAGDVELIATLRDTAATRDLLDQLPLTLSMRDHGGVEKASKDLVRYSATSRTTTCS